MRTEGQTDMTKLIVTFRKFSNAPHNTKTSVMNCQFNYWQYEAKINKETQ